MIPFLAAIVLVVIAIVILGYVIDENGAETKYGAVGWFCVAVFFLFLAYGLAQ